MRESLLENVITQPSRWRSCPAAGAKQGFELLFLSFLTWPADRRAVQMMCARIGMVSAQGLIGSLREIFPRPAILLVAVALSAQTSR